MRRCIVWNGCFSFIKRKVKRSDCSWRQCVKVLITLKFILLLFKANMCQVLPLLVITVRLKRLSNLSVMITLHDCMTHECQLFSHQKYTKHLTYTHEQWKRATPKGTSISQGYILNLLSHRISGDFINTKDRDHIDSISSNVKCPNVYTHVHIPTVVKADLSSFKPPPYLF